MIKLLQRFTLTRVTVHERMYTFISLVTVESRIMKMSLSVARIRKLCSNLDYESLYVFLATLRCGDV